MDIHYSSATDLWATPQDLFDQLNEEFAFTLDVCAVPDNAKCEAYYTEADDGLQQSWTGSCWMNPPYGNAIPNWVAKAHQSADNGATVVSLVPARVDTRWWWNHCRYAEIRFLRGRLKFGGGANPAPFPSAVVIFGRQANVIWWER
jgi:phage N-6-adenine-methyltransferase